MMKPGNGGYNVSGDLAKSLGRLLTAWLLARVREIWQISRVVVRDFSHEPGRLRQSVPLAWDLVNGGAVATCHQVVKIHAAAQSHCCVLYSLLKRFTVRFTPTVCRLDVVCYVQCDAATAANITIRNNSTALSGDHLLPTAIGLE